MQTPETLTLVRPSKRQLRITHMAFYAFIHFTVNTFTGREWGDGTESPSVFNPVSLNCMQWAESVRDGGMKGIILTCKHHDGFCLWPSQFTEHSVKNSPWKNGTGDVVRELSDACRKTGLAFGIYLSPWDRHEPTYGQGKPYDDYFVHQLEELLTDYGPIFSVWFDGACGEGKNGKKQYYDWDRYYETVRKLQPDACISVCGPDIRWCGNEAGQTRESEWSVVPARMVDTERIASLSQQTDDASFRRRPLRAQDMDLGSRELVRDEPDLIWYPAEVNTSIRPGWFYHSEEDNQIKSLNMLKDIYLRAVGGNASFLLNIPPAPSGLMADVDVQRLHELGTWIRESFRTSLLTGDMASASSCQPQHPISCAVLDDASYWQSAFPSATITIQLSEPTRLSYLVMREYIELSQRIENYAIDVFSDDWKTLYTGTTVGSQKIVPLHALRASALRIRIQASRMEPTLSFLALYAETELTFSGA
ncbi:MAG: alpha-L-fucosidase [Clostridiales bacterium]|nr:alpha-L-fucosidase [Clostridiales bacterium]